MPEKINTNHKKIPIEQFRLIKQIYLTKQQNSK